MALDFSTTLQNALELIGFRGNYQQFIIHDKEEERNNHDEIIGLYGNAKWKIIDILNQNYSSVLKDKFDLYNWLNNNTGDEVSYFLNEAGSNVLNHSEFKAPSGFHLWMGENGFIIGIEQKGRGFDAELVNENMVKKNQGSAFQFFRNCKSKIFFDDHKDARMVFMATHF